MPQDVIVRTLLDSSDRLVATIAADLATRKYELTLGSLENSLTSTQSWLVYYVPRTLLVLAEKRVETRIEALGRAMKNKPLEEQLEDLKEIKILQNRQKKYKNKLRIED